MAARLAGRSLPASLYTGVSPVLSPLPPRPSMSQLLRRLARLWGRALPPVLLAFPALSQQFQHVPGAIPGTPRWSEGVELVDVDVDGDLDVVFADGEGFSSAGTKRQNVLIVNQLVETGSFGFADESVARLGANTSNAKGVTAGDVDGDGYVDLLFANAFDTDVPFLYMNRGAAQPGFFDLESAARGFTTPLSSAGAQFGDLDDDGDLDVILCDSGPSFFGGTGGRPRLYLNDGTGHFTEDPVSMNASLKNAHMDVQLVDLDADWDLDFVGLCRATNGGENHYVMLNDGQAAFTDVSDLMPGTSSSVYEAEVGDLDGDDDHDLFFVSLTGFQEGPVRNELVELGSLGFTAGAALAGTVDDNEIAFLDYDNDSDYDVVVGSLGSQERLYRNVDNLDFNANDGQITAVGDSTLDVAVGDVDNDGDYDLVTAQGESNPAQWDNKLYSNTGGADVVPPAVPAVDLPAQSAGWPVVLHARHRDQVLDDGVSYVRSWALVAPRGAAPEAVTLSGDAFAPNVVNLTPGGSIVVTNQNGGPETVTSATPPYTFDYPLADNESVEHVFVAAGTYDVVSTGASGAALQVFVSGAPVQVDGFAMGGQQHRYAVPALPPSTAGELAAELYFEDWPGNVSVVDNTAVPYPGSIGVGYCGPAVRNSSGMPAAIAAFGSDVVDDGDLTLTAADLPSAEFGYFLAAKAPGFVATPPGSEGNLCLGGTIGRFSQDVQSSGTEGFFSMAVDLTDVPQLGAVQAGESWFFQAWFRDHNPTATSNFTDGVEIQFL